MFVCGIIIYINNTVMRMRCHNCFAKMAAQLQGSESNDISPLTEDETRKLVDACFEAKSNAHAPYSKFKVGSALLTDDGTIYTGKVCYTSLQYLIVCSSRVFQRLKCPFLLISLYYWYSN